jgi:hypothetical protein
MDRPDHRDLAFDSRLVAAVQDLMIDACGACHEEQSLQVTGAQRSGPAHGAKMYIRHFRQACTTMLF